MANNELYLVVLPLIHLSTGLTEQTITLLPGRDLATEFFKDEVEAYITMFKNRGDKYLTGGHVTGYEVFMEDTHDGRVVVRVTQNVA
jgi:hypothetical protein